MPAVPWFRQPVATLEREQSRLLTEWVTQEVVPFSAFWRERLGGLRIGDIDDARSITVALERQVAGAGGPGNPALLLSPTETEFKRHAPRAELATAAREAGGRGASGRREAIWHRYKPVHVHEAGVDRLLAVAYTRADLDRLHLAGARLAQVLGLGAEDALVNLVPAGPSIRFWGLYHAALAARMAALHPRAGGESPTAAGRRGLALLPASALAVPSHEMAMTLEELADLGVAAPNLRLLLPVGSPPDARARIRLTELGERLAGRPVRVQAIWAPETSRVLYGEAPVAANDPPEATYGLLTYPDMEWLTVRDPARDTEVGRGEGGELVVTSLGWRGTAFLRLATGAWIGGIERTRPHPVTGATVPRLSPAAVDGAWQPRVRGADGVTGRADLRPARKLVEREAERLGLRDWSIGAVDGELVLALDAPEVDAARLDGLVAQLGAACGVRPAVAANPTLAGRRPQVGRAGIAGSDPS